MAVRFDALDETFIRSTNLPTNTAFTMMGWFMISVDRNDYSTFLSYGTSVGTNKKTLQTGADGVTLTLWDGLAEDAGTTLSVGTWYHITLTHDGTTPRGYLNGVLDVSGTNIVDPLTSIEVGRSENSEWLNGRAAAIKIYSAVLTTDEMLQEMRQYLPVRTANINSWFPLFNTTPIADYSGNAFDFGFGGGSITVEDGPPIPWKAGRQRILIPPAAAGGGPVIPVFMNQYRQRRN